jgi:hypothetical protein
VFFHNLLPTPIELVQLIKIRKQKASMLTSGMCVDDAYERYQKRNINATQKKKGVPSHRISAFESFSQDDIKEFCAEDTEEDKFC